MIIRDRSKKARTRLKDGCVPLQLSAINNITRGERAVVVVEVVIQREVGCHPHLTTNSINNAHTQRLLLLILLGTMKQRNNTLIV